MGFTVTSEVSLDRVACVLCTALEGGSNYWYRIEEFIKPEKIDPEIEKEWGEYRQYAYPLSPGGQLVISDFASHGDEDELEIGFLNLGTIAAGLKVMSEKFPTHYKDLVDETDDADTGDCLLQCCIFGDVVFG